jgi:formylglycine-generating enzyme required for sulfatase activity
MAQYPDMKWIRGGVFTMGSDKYYPEEKPIHDVRLNSFWIETYEVSNDEFTKFVDATNHTTFAEIAPDAETYPDALPELLVAGSLVFKRPDRQPKNLQDYTQWWAWVPGSNWRHPRGPSTNLNNLDKHPVVHITISDAEAYCKWKGRELPTEAQWEYAARGGLKGKSFTWGDSYGLDEGKGKPLANSWQGEFPTKNLKLDGFAATAPVGSFPPNDFGLYDMAGNVWEWTTDWFNNGHDANAEPEGTKKKACCAPENPRGGKKEKSYDPNQSVQIPRKVLKGGSHLCAPNYCLRYRPAARVGMSIDSSTTHIGFRCVLNS